MVEFTLTGVEPLKAWLKATSEQIEEAIMQGMVTGMGDFERWFMKDQLTGHKGENYGLNVGTGALRSSFVIRREGDLVKMSTSSKYAHIHQTGGAINMKDKLLTIPATPEAKGKFAKDFDLIFIKTLRGGMALLDIERHKIMFWLATKVNIPKRLYLLESFKVQGQKYMRDAANKNLKKLLRN